MTTILIVVVLLMLLGGGGYTAIADGGDDSSCTREGICGVSTNLWGRPMEYVLRTKTSGIFADGAFVPPVVIPLLSVLAIVLWATYKAVM